MLETLDWYWTPTIPLRPRKRREALPNAYISPETIDRLLTACSARNITNDPAAAVSIYHTGLPFSIPVPSSDADDAERKAAFCRLSQTFTTLYGRDLTQESPQNVISFLPKYVNQAMRLLNASQPDPLRGPAPPEADSMLMAAASLWLTPNTAKR
ncbi:hypothetical protein EYZ11_011581 [Aspergillus tanneri]|uniref:Uncharacterized protein n=1 Tax=Aspergillus tanneri TaxID=1220188 RepID=A0A4S3J2G8_9EURO|nr:hypothetical protein EYZ11_011581 [Aspergillus tanneri]